MRVLYMGNEPPVEWRGAPIVMYRLVIQPSDMKVLVISPPLDDTFPGITLPSLPPSVTFLPFRSPQLIRRLKRSRFYEWAWAYEQFVATGFISPWLWQKVRAFNPEVIVALADNSLSHLARKLARRLKIPLATYFADWKPRYFPALASTRPMLERRWQELYQQSDVAFCTSEGMREALGPHPNAHVIYPLGNLEVISPATDGEQPAKHQPTLVYAGNIEGTYGSMLAQLRRALLQRGKAKIALYGLCDWPAEEQAAARADGSYHGFTPNRELVKHLAKADFLLVVMSFDPSVRFFVETAFTTKFCDYCAFGKPIIVWGPEYCTVVKFAQQRRSALVVTDPSPQSVCDAVEKLTTNRDEQKRLSEAAMHLHQGELNPVVIRRKFKSELEKIAG
ncbi:glycosyltransferase family protein [Chloracidobacterium thermophilum]|jgi:hypothetical protein|uniref:Glycosyltransferase n=1 Tax=Chloracidobacterium thermophilum (strain B) TaxID=981222 RepID=G2LEK0_CHLTF|nr:hypothetical protein [Chloracidobacterium thermophilum]AEP11663.1 hypothetical protein Cabther_A0906 [Chloracidobacterium thermophilum B]QUV79542.1 hypothetical protein J8C08_04600 [Chloracidobacterium thermophilum]